jgi:hypothetical protein
MNESKSIPKATQSPFANGELARDPMQFMQEIRQRQQKIDHQVGTAAAGPAE